MKIKKVFALALATSLVLPGVSAFADDNDRRKTVRIAPELKARLRAVIQRTKDSLDYAERIIRANTTNPKVKRLERLVNKQKEIIRKLEILVG